MTIEDELRTALRSAINDRDQFWKQRDALAGAIVAAIRMLELGNPLSAMELLKSVAHERRPTTAPDIGKDWTEHEVIINNQRLILESLLLMMTAPEMYARLDDRIRYLNERAALLQLMAEREQKAPSKDQR